MSTRVADDSKQLVDEDELAHNIQPHLAQQNGATGSSNAAVSLEYINPALDDGDDKPENNQMNNNHHKSESPVSNSQTDTQQASDVTVSSPPVYYSNRTGESTVVQEPVVIRQPNGMHVIRTQQCCVLAPHRHVQERPIKIKHIKVIKAFSILAIVIFFPLGIPAMFYAFKSEKEFHDGVMRGELDTARKYAKRAEKLIIFSVMGALLVAVAVFAVVERQIMANDEEYWKARTRNGIVPGAG